MLPLADHTPRSGFMSRAALIMSLLCVFAALLRSPALADSLPLDEHALFNHFFKALSELPAREQVRYCALPFTIEMRTTCDDNGPLQCQCLNSTEEIRQATRTWRTLIMNGALLRRTQWKIYQMPHEDGALRVGVGIPGRTARTIYYFRQINEKWRLVKIRGG